MSSAVSFNRIDRKSLTGRYDTSGDTQWCYVTAPLESGSGNADATFFDTTPEDVMRLGADLLASAGAVRAEDIAEVAVSEQSLLNDYTSFLADTILSAVHDWAAEQCACDDEHKPLALAWLSLSEQQRAYACEAYLGAVQDRAKNAEGVE